MASANQKCRDCHTKPAAAPMKTGLPGAFHDPMAKKGTCIDCHVAEVAKGKKAPTKCGECHIKANA
jgi:nitrate/TMAO reductase-like tetraheme cytochrome c subunit